jgi:hypothetical protein
MNVFYEEDGVFKVGTILADNDSTLQVEAAHGKRSKIKAGWLLFRFEDPGKAHFMEQSQQAAASIDTDFLWRRRIRLRGIGARIFRSPAQPGRGRRPANTAARLADVFLQERPRAL